MSYLPSVLNKKRVAKVNENVFKKVRYVIQICHLFLSLCTPLRTPLENNESQRGGAARDGNRHQ